MRRLKLALCWVFLVSTVVLLVASLLRGGLHLLWAAGLFCGLAARSAFDRLAREPGGRR